MNNSLFSTGKILWCLLAMLVFIINPALAESINFDGWTHQKFSVFSSNKYITNMNQVLVESDKTVSMIWSATEGKSGSTKKASWTWEVTKTVPPTDLTIKGSDDRNLAMYFVFAEAKDAPTLQHKSLLSMLDNKSIRVLMYVFGGAHKRGDFLLTPYLGNQGKTIILRPSGLGTFQESVNLDQDFLTAFGAPITTLVGLAISADSDDTKTKIRASVADLELWNP